MSHKAISRLLAVIVIALAGETAASAHGDGGAHFPTLLAYPLLPGFYPERSCHITQRRVLTRNGWRLYPVRICG